MELTVLSTKVSRDLAALVHQKAKSEGMTASSWLKMLAEKGLCEA